ncbi:sigma-70 family RNA polymerase sigma factor [Carboxylicivirga mesophila]|uniref:Sigma-70 family RNA polymerase sigma factor n=1 Tax=Carboxylicivirga mesophila TaxID=1166478 RepID=A0ABS5KG55_9BACT|nr:sigma-70 family RNA polymerase sigma factor [Carboxylicivirga mesophila]MBS2213980.1 sigma-70 family RNA polymerase sigma factor [Carboxylicivirga mesophila]
MSDPNDIKLIKLVRAGDVSAFAQIIEKYQHMAYTLANSIVKNHQEAEEVAQDAFFKAYKSLDKFKGDAEFSTWLYRIVYNTAISKIRSRKAETITLESQEVDKQNTFNFADNLNRLERQERKVILKRALKELKEEDAFIIILYYYKEQSIEEIEKATGLSKSNIKVKLHRGRKQLQQTLEQLLRTELKSFI